MSDNNSLIKELENIKKEIENITQKRRSCQVVV